MKNANFIAIDFETANYKKMPCQIGVIVVQNGEIVEKITELIQPPGNRYSKNCIAIHGITPEHTKNAPTFPEIWERLKPYFDANFIVAHNCPFDTDVLEKALDYYDLPKPIFMGKACTYQITGAPLEEACRANNIPLASHHDGGCDAEACALLFLKYLNGNLNLKEKDSVNQDSGKSSFFSLLYKGHKVLSGDILKKDLSGADPNNPFYDKKVVITGVFSQERIEIAKKLKDMGADIDNGITKNTNFVFIGNEPGPKKIEKIKALKEDGYNITELYQKDIDAMLFNR